MKIKNIKLKKNLCIILTTVPNIKVANSIAKKILEKKIAVCINVIPKIVSFYFWNNVIAKSSEIKIIIKTFQKFKKNIFLEIKKLHPYSIPEILMIKVHDVDTNYLKWMYEVFQ